MGVALAINANRRIPPIFEIASTQRCFVFSRYIPFEKWDHVDSMYYFSKGKSLKKNEMYQKRVLSNFC